MESAIKLCVEHKYPPLPCEGFVTVRILGIAPGEAVGYYEYGRHAGRCVLVHLHDGVAEQHELQVDPDLLEEGALGKALPVLMKVGRRLALLVNLRLLYVVDTALQVIEEIPIENELPVLDELRPNGQPPGLYADRMPGFSDTNVLPVFFPGNWFAPRAIQFMGLLQVEPEKKVARWTEANGKLLFRLDHGDFPATCLGDASPLVHHAVWRNGRLQVYVIGNSHTYIKYGMAYFGLATLDRSLRPVEKPYMESVPRDETKKRGRYGEFTSSLRYCILTPVYPTSDPWKAKQRLFDLESQQLHEVVLPRGFSQYNVVEHAHDTYWLLSRDTREQFEIASCSQK